MKRLVGFATCFYLVCSVKLSVFAWQLNVIAYQGFWRHLLNLGLISSLIIILCSLPKRPVLALVAQFFLSAFCIMHLVSWRVLGDILSLMSVEQLSLAKYAGAGFINSLTPWDLLYFLDIAIWLYWLYRPPVRRLPLAKACLGGAGLGLIFLSLLWFSFSEDDKTRLISRRKNLGVMLTAGTVGYHLVDGGDFFSEFMAPNRFTSIPNEWIQQNQDQLKRSWEVTDPYRGIWQGKNLWLIQVESLQAFALDAEVDGQPVMPFLRSLAHKSIQFERCYDQTASGVSLDCDFLINNSLLPSVGRPTFYRYRNTDFFSLTHIFNGMGYLSVYVHDMNPSFFNLPVISRHFGYKIRRFANETPPPPKPDELIGLGMRDYALLFRVLNGLESIPGRFFAHTVCPMGHSPFQELSKEQELLRLPKHLEGTVMGDYLQMCRFRDQDLERLFADWARSPLAKNTAICIYGDHSALMTREDLSNFWGRPVDVLEHAEQQRIVMLFYDAEHQGKVDKPCGLIDFAPTILYLMGQTEHSPVWLGRNIFSPEPSLVTCRRYGFVVTAAGLRSLDGSDGIFPLLTEAENAQVLSQLLLSERLCLQNQIRKFAGVGEKGATP